MCQTKFHYSQPLPSKEDIARLSNNLSTIIPADFMEFLEMVNGGSPDRPVFVYTGKSGKPKKDMLHRIFGISKEYRDADSIERINKGFHEMDSGLVGRYLIIGYSEEEHLLIDCLEGHLILQNLNHTYGIPEGGFKKLIMKSFRAFIDSLSPDPKGEWKPLPPFRVG